MSLDIPTLMLTLLLGYLLLSIVLAVALGGRRHDQELRSWTLGSWALLGGFLMLTARVWVPMPVSVLGGNSLILLGMCLHTEALYRFLLDKPAPRWVWGILGGGMVMLLAVMFQPLSQRSPVISAMLGLALLPGVHVIWVHGRRAERSLRTVGVTLALAALVLMFRGVHGLVSPHVYASLTHSSLSQGLTFLIAFLCLLGAGFGFVLASFERLAQRMEVLATVDGLTGSMNRATTDTMLAHALARCRREGQPLAFVALDLDHFKRINDLHGHSTGDAVLRAFVATVKLRLRAGDVVGRLGGEEFGLVLPNTGAAGAEHVAEAVRRAIEKMQVSNADGQLVPVTVSAGVAVAPAGPGVSGEQLYREADRALYRAKALGRNRVEPSEAVGSGLFETAQA
ncbi:GGDEF domain-containing protein [Roseateles toxinivorans]|uniref:diguanylate cyclase n=1 Tax=Roseateles toxinivorans TaxID=270368 RepID=A0A4R6QRQ7_9BURK|nr:GGDEF domain-containing protein [Roseateles toxinivorans]TDP73292.1 diguanylate cyclase (GGDEF)-like protein [Roseateles toxinivorans]